jgi:hypothetical protein
MAGYRRDFHKDSWYVLGMSMMTAKLEVGGLTKRRMAELAANAKSLGMTPQRYVKELVEQGLELEHAARTMTFDQILAPLRKGLAHIDDTELDRLVDRARTRHHKRVTRKKR